MLTGLTDLSASSVNSASPARTALRIYLKEIGDRKTMLKATQVEAAVGIILFWQYIKVTKNRKAYGRREKQNKIYKGISHPNI